MRSPLSKHKHALGDCPEAPLRELVCQVQIHPASCPVMMSTKPPGQAPETDPAERGEGVSRSPSSC